MNQTEGPVIVSEGDLMTLNCTYQTRYSNPYLFWYVQHLNKAPQLLLKGLTAGTKVEHGEWVAMTSSRGSSQPWGGTQVSHIAGRRFTV